MKNKINLVKILEHVPRGRMLLSPICGDCFFDLIDIHSDYPIRCIAYNNYLNDSSRICFTSDGRYKSDFYNGECVLFPSKKNQDWTKFVF